MSQRAMAPDATTEPPPLIALVNPASGRRLQRAAVIRRIETLCKDRAPLRQLATESALRDEVRQLPDRPDLEVAILAGDGTHMRVMSALLEARGPNRLPILVSVPFGTVNTISGRWGAGRSPFRALEAWLNRDPMVLRRQPTLAITIDDRIEMCCCTVGTGLIARFFTQYEALGGGAGAAVRIALRSFLSSLVSSSYSQDIMKRLECRISVDGNAIAPERFSLVVSSVFKDVGLGIKVTYRAGNAVDRVALVTSSLPAGKLGPQFWRVLTARPLVDPQGIDCLAREWTLEFAERGPIIVDGDRFDVRSLRVRPGPVWSVLTPIE